MFYGLFFSKLKISGFIAKNYLFWLKTHAAALLLWHFCTSMAFG
jgi:hypothetical protein